jgi:hypothetical protein
VIHVYGVVDGLDELPPLEGLGGAPLERRRIGDLDLVVSDGPGADVTQDAVLRHAEVVEELTNRCAAVLPAQFGHPFGDEGELDAAVEAKAPELARGLERVRGCVEFGVRVAGPVEREAALSGTEYMRARLAEERLVEPLARLSRACSVNAYLVPAENVPAFQDAVLRLEEEHPELTVVCTGPWPPYSFGSAS